GARVRQHTPHPTEVLPYRLLLADRRLVEYRQRVETHEDRHAEEQERHLPAHRRERAVDEREDRPAAPDRPAVDPDDGAAARIVVVIADQRDREHDQRAAADSLEYSQQQYLPER